MLKRNYSMATFIKISVPQVRNEKPKSKESRQSENFRAGSPFPGCNKKFQ